MPRRFYIEDLPEGLHTFHDPADNEVVIADAQGYKWVAIRRGAEGDPETWHNAILELVATALDAERLD